MRKLEKGSKMISNVSFGQKFTVSSADNTAENYNRFNAYCQNRGKLNHETLYTEEQKDGEKFCTLDIHDKLAPRVEDYCKIYGIKFSKPTEVK